MPPSNRPSSHGHIILSYMDFLIEPGPRAPTITRFCQYCGINRATFYRYFESLEDLDERFLPIYFHSRWVEMDSPLRRSSDLPAYFQAIVSAMQLKYPFFQAVYTDPRFSVYREAWQDQVHRSLLPLFVEAKELCAGPVLWQVKFDLTVGVINRYLELSLWTQSSEDLTTLSTWMVEFLLGGLFRLHAKAGDGRVFDDEALDRLLLARKAGPGVIAL